MKLLNGILRPGIVLEYLGEGKIKAAVPGLFSEVDEIEKLPPIYHWSGVHANSFSEPKKNDEVWVLNLEDNPLQLHWFRKDPTIENDKEILEEENVEILCNRETGMSWATIYFSDGSGWVIKNDDSKIQIRKDGTILLDSAWPHRVIDINPQNISLGSKGTSKHKAVYGDVLMDILLEIQSTLDLMKKASMTNPYTMALGKAIGKSADKIKEDIPKMISSHVTLD